METMKDFLDQIRKRYNLQSEAELAKTIGISPQALHQHKTARSKHFSEPVAYNIARLLNLNPAYVLVCLRVESADNRSTKSVWLEMLHKVDRYAAILVLSVFVGFLTQPAKASVFNITPTQYTLYALARLWGLLGRFWGGFWDGLWHTGLAVTINKNRRLKWNLAL